MSQDKPHVSREHLLHLLNEMMRIGRLEERCAQLYQEEKIRGFLHLYNGEEAVAVGVMQALSADDAIVSTYREHGHALARGIPMASILAEMLGRMTGCSRGRGGSMHLFDAQSRFYGGNAIVGAGLPLAVGLALADQTLGRQAITCCFFGDGAVAEGAFHESLNLAKLWQLPVLFVCENNGYAMGTALQFEQSEPRLHLKAASYGIPAQEVDGMHVVEVEALARQACQAIHAGEGPQFIECHTYRLRGHSMFDTQLYRSNDEIEQWKAKSPITQLGEWLQTYGMLDDAGLQAMAAQVDAEIEAAVAEAEAGALEPIEQLAHFVYTEEPHG